MDWRERVAAYLHERLPSAESVAVGRVGAMPAGASNETAAVDLLVTCGGTTTTVPLVLRPQRRDGILAPYDVERQYRVMRALKRTAVPVPTVAWLERDAGVLGAPFFFMHRLSAETLPLFWYGGGSPRLMAAARALAAVHRVDWRPAGLGFLLPPGADESAPPSPLLCELALWDVRAERMGVARHPVLVALRAYLVANEPPDARHALIHGDPNPGNYLFRGDAVVAVVDWELGSIGDPRSDLGFYAALMSVFGGWPSDDGHSVLSYAYEEATGAPLTHLPYYAAWGLYRMAVVMSGWGWGYGGLDSLAGRLSHLLGPGWAG